MRTLFALVGLLLILSPPGPRYNWARLNGPWMSTYYHQDFIGRHHGAYWNGLKCRGLDGEAFPDVVTDQDLGVAMPGPEFYCLPVKICHGDRCVIAIASDVMRDYRIRRGSLYYSHLDLWPATARELGLEYTQYGNLEVFIGATTVWDTRQDNSQIQRVRDRLGD